MSDSRQAHPARCASKLAVKLQRPTSLQRFSFQLSVFLLLAAFTANVWAVPSLKKAVQPTPSPAKNEENPAPQPQEKPDSKKADNPNFAPSWNTQKQARTWVFNIPPPRGQICDRNGLPLANSRIGYNLAVSFAQLQFSEAQIAPFVQAGAKNNSDLASYNDLQVGRFVQEEAAALGKLLGRKITASQEAAIKHYRNRPLLPWVLLQNLSDSEVQKVRDAKRESWELLPFYARQYPNGFLAGHVLGHIGLTGRFLDSPIENSDPLWPDTEGRDGLEKTFDSVLKGESGQLNITFNTSGKKASENVTLNPIPGKNIITTIDIELQKLCEKTLAAKAKRGAIVLMNPQTGDILALASWPPVDPNLFVPFISNTDFQKLNNDPNNPLIGRAFRSSYPPGSTFKCFVGLAGLSSGKISSSELFDCPNAFEVGNRVFLNWKKEGTGPLNFAQALEQSCNTWFYQAGLKMGGQVIVDYATRIGLGEKTGIPLPDEREGRIPTDEYMRKKYGLRLTGGAVANLSIGQGDTEITPLQMAQAMSVIANGGKLYQARLVQQIQDITGDVINAYPVRVRREISIPQEAQIALRTGMIQVVEGGNGTAHQARVEKVTVAGKTGTAQWGAKPHQKTAAWFAGFAPAEGPRIAFAALYEGEENHNDVHGGTNAAPMIGMVLREYFRDKSKAQPIVPLNEDGTPAIPEIAPPVPAAVPVKARPVEPVKETPKESEPQQKPSFWKRLFGLGPKENPVAEKPC